MFAPPRLQSLRLTESELEGGLDFANTLQFGDEKTTFLKRIAKKFSVIEMNVDSKIVHVLLMSALRRDADKI